MTVNIALSRLEIALPGFGQRMRIWYFDIRRAAPILIRQLKCLVKN